MRLPLLTSAMLLLAACAAAPAADGNLYARLGGQAGIERIVAELIDRTVADPRTRRSFEGVKVERVKEKLAEQVCSLADGPCRYTGDAMRPVHEGLKVTEAEFYLMVQFLVDALGRAGVDEGAKNELLRRLAPMKRDIVFG